MATVDLFLLGLHCNVWLIYLMAVTLLLRPAWVEPWYIAFNVLTFAYLAVFLSLVQIVPGFLMYGLGDAVLFGALLWGMRIYVRAYPSDESSRRESPLSRLFHLRVLDRFFGD